MKMSSKVLPWLLLFGLAGCASVTPGPPTSPPAAEPAPEIRPPAAEPARDDALVRELRQQVDRLTAQLADAQRRAAYLAEEHRRGEVALRESQRRVDELQQKLDALLAIDRDTRRRPKTPVK